MKKIGLLALVSIFGLTGLTFSAKNAELLQTSPRIVEKKNANTGVEEPEIITPEFNVTSKNIDIHEINGVELNAFVLSNNIIEGDSEIKYEDLTIDFEIDGYQIDDFSFTDDKNCLKFEKIEAKEENKYSVTFKPGSIPADKMTVLTVSIKDEPSVNFKMNVHFVNAYFNVFDKYIIKPLITNNKNTKFEIVITDGSEVSGIEASQELILKEISNKDENGNNIVKKQDLTFNQLEYKFETKNLGEATYEVDFVREIIPGYKAIIRKAKLTIKIVESDSYYFFELDDQNKELIQLENDENNRQVLETNQMYTFFIGNNTADFDPRDFELKKTSDIGAFRTIELRNDLTFGVPFLKLVLITGGDARKSKLDIGYVDSKDSKSIYFEINQPKYTIKVNETKIQSPYYINENIDFTGIQGLIEVYEGAKKVDVSPDFSVVKKILGKQRVYVNLNSIGKTVSFDIDITLNPKEAKDSTLVTTSGMITQFRILMERLAIDIPAVYDNAEEAYKYAANEYKYLNADARTALIDDYNFIKTYRKFIIQNDFKESFFEGIIVRIDNSRYIVPTVTLAGFLIVFGIIIGVSLHTIYNKKGDKDNE